MSTEKTATPLRACIDVDDMERAITFYTRGLGLRPGRRFDAGWMELLAGEVPVDLLQRPAGSPANSRPDAPARSYGRHWTPVHLDLVVEDVEAAAARAEAAGAVLEDEIQSYRWGRIARIADPFGHGFCLLEFRGKGYGEIVES